jgi:hypothetical protein
VAAAVRGCIAEVLGLMALKSTGSDRKWNLATYRLSSGEFSLTAFSIISEGMVDMRKLMASVLLTVAALAVTPPAKAVPVTYDFDGAVTYTSWSGSDADRARLLGLLPGSLDGGNDLFFRPFSGSLTADGQDSLDLDPDPGVGRYRGFDVLSAFSVSLEGFDFALDPARAGDSASARISYFPEDGFETVNVTASLRPGLLSGVASALAIQLNFKFFDFGVTAFMSDRIPADLSLLKDVQVELQFIDTTTQRFVAYGAQFNSLTRRVTVPEAGTVALFAAGMVGLLWFAGAGSRRRLIAAI